MVFYKSSGQASNYLCLTLTSSCLGRELRLILKREKYSKWKEKVKGNSCGLLPTSTRAVKAVHHW